MRSKHLGIYYSLLAALVSVSGDAFAGIRISNKSRNQYVNEMTYQAQQAQIASAEAARIANIPTELPVPVADQDVSNKLLAGQTDATVSMEQLDRCSMIFPNGEFLWARPMIGVNAGGPATCVAVVEMRTVEKNKEGKENVIARAYLAAGDSIVCNISSFPESTYSTENFEVEVPADQEPTIEEVVKIMNEEQKQNAGLKIAAGALVGALAGNVVGKSAPGSDNLLGTNDEKVKGSVVGALAGAGVMAGNAYAGKVAGDTILSAGVNAAAGGVMGNIVASGDDVMRIEKCEIDHGNGNVEESTCLWGVVEEFGEWSESETPVAAFVSALSTTSTIVCTNKDGVQARGSDAEYWGCTGARLADGRLAGYDYTANQNKLTKTDKTLEEIKRDGWDKAGSVHFYCKDDNGELKKTDREKCDTSKLYIKFEGIPNKITNTIPAMIVGVTDKTFGYKSSDWTNLKKNLAGKDIVKREGIKGNATDKLDNKLLDDFRPVYLSASSGGIIDLDNKARMKSTMIGAGAGGALGAFTAYQGAQTDVENRWAAEVRAYKDSLQKIYCGTGKRFLTFYNDVVGIPPMREE